MLGSSKFFAAILLAVAAAFLRPADCQAQNYYPDHPVVKEMVDRAVQYLSTTNLKASGSESFGIEVLGAYTIYKVDGDPDHPVVAHGLNISKNYVDKITAAQGGFEAKTVYHMAVACMLLASVSVDNYGPQLLKARDFFLRIQQAGGAFG